MRFGVIGLGALLLAGNGFISAAADETIGFERKAVRFEVPVVGAGEALRIFAPDTETMIVRTRDNEANHAFHLFALEDISADTPVPSRTVQVPGNAIFYALGEMPEGEREALLIFTEKGVSSYRPDTNTFKLLVETTSLFRQGTSLRFQRSGFAQDINDDGRFDLLVQDFDGLKIFLQRADGSFTGEQLIPQAPEMRLTGVFSNDNISDTEFSLPAEQTPTFKIFPSYISDGTGDGKSDLIFLVGRDLIIFEQMSPEVFSKAPKVVTLPFELRGNTWRDEILSAEKNTDQRNFREVTVYRVLDMDGDNVLDVVTVNNEASGLLDRDQKFQVYFGTAENGKIRYNEAPDQTLELNGIGGAGFRDVNNDGRLDFVVTSTRINIRKIISFLINRRLSVQTRIYLDNGSGNFAEDRDYRRSQSIKIDLSRGVATTPPYGYADFNGDEVIDLMATKRDRMEFLAGGEGEPFKRKMGEIRDEFPTEGPLVTTEDLNGDGKADIFIRYSPVGFDGEEKKNQVVLHMSK